MEIGLKKYAKMTLNEFYWFRRRQVIEWVRKDEENCSLYFLWKFPSPFFFWYLIILCHGRFYIANIYIESNWQLAGRMSGRSWSVGQSCVGPEHKHYVRHYIVWPKNFKGLSEVERVVRPTSAWTVYTYTCFNRVDGRSGILYDIVTSDVSLKHKGYKCD